ncbi:MAG: hypothetical protein U0229_20770 [Anaeromyxobacter sp.]
MTERTVYRAFVTLRLADLPLHAEQGRGGGYALDRHYTLPPVNLNAREAAVLVALGAYAKRMRLIPFQETLEAALDKVRDALSLSAQRELLWVVGGPGSSACPRCPLRPECAGRSRTPGSAAGRCGSGTRAPTRPRASAR